MSVLWEENKGGGMMERLTSSDIDYCERYCDIDKNRCSIYSSCIMRKSFQKLKEYEDLEEQGLLLRLPCKVGSTVYHIASKRILEVENVDLFFLCLCVAECRFGKSVFLTQAEAEQKLNEMESD